MDLTSDQIIELLNDAIHQLNSRDRAYYELKNQQLTGKGFKKCRVLILRNSQPIFAQYLESTSEDTSIEKMTHRCLKIVLEDIITAGLSRDLPKGVFMNLPPW